ncbi:ABC transporter permease [Desulfomonile tiedjei]|uniref:ABC-type transport system, involved in lipoprotein release, permease component n=1 Tax=Desulfomonile tiedjei (strain ATCC 49306 / DSM 6799 / DCB-1) TaxID=706587 RepID=I4CDK6_DESTA|nr:FtsX-like permease family protein [Desulfomonile tiedjei]AFM27647.1 ABC-type transport system, involved in lipoprotein release, permease component [Desulfomonile tiedjei DSM 6799]
MPVPFSYSVRNLWTRKLTTMLTAGGMALVAFVFAAVLMLAEGLEQTLVETGSPENAIVLRGAAETEVASVIERSSGSIIEVQPEIAQNGLGETIAAKEALVLVTLPKRSTGKPTNVIVRGVGPHSLELRPQVKLIAGRLFRPGSREIIVGKGLAENMKGAHLGGSLHFAMSDWVVVGTFDAGQTAFSSEVWTDADQLMQAFRRDAYSSLIARVPGRHAFESLKQRLENDPRLTVQVKREMDFYKEQSEVMSKFIRILGIAMTTFFSFGAILGAMVTMYSAVANRIREIGTLRAIGFSRASILVAFLAESLLLGLIGGLVGIVCSSVLQFLTISTVNWETFSELAFGFRLTPAIAGYTLAFALIMGFMGGLFPAWRAARLKIVDSLRQD